MASKTSKTSKRKTDAENEFMSITEFKNNSIKKSVGHKTKSFRTTLHLTQAELAEKVGVSQNYISRLENGLENPTLYSLLNIANALEVDIIDLFHLFTDKKIGQFEWHEAENEALLREHCESIYQRRIFKTFYPDPYDSCQITGLMEFMIYLPLINPISLYEALLEIDYANDSVSKEAEVAFQLSSLIDDIEDSPAKQFADLLYSELEERRKTHNLAFSLDSKSKYNEEYVGYLNEINVKIALIKRLEQTFLTLYAGAPYFNNFHSNQLENEKQRITKEKQHLESMKSKRELENTNEQNQQKLI